MAFASLLSATDPVATLAVFSSLKVHPTLYALVYGEAVINDAVAIVLYRTFTGFLTQEVTTNAMLWAVGTFLGILFLSVFVGLVFGLLATLAFRYVNVSGQGREVRWEREFADRLSAVKRMLPKMPVVKLNLDGEEGEGDGEGPAPTKPAPTVAVASATGPAPATVAQAVAARTASSSGPADKPPSAADLVIAAAAKHSHSNAPLSPTASSHAPSKHAQSTVDLQSGIAETGILLLFAYVSFSLAEAVALSGIVSSLVCGIAMNVYTRRILTLDGRTVSTAVFRMLSTLADTAIFFQIGLNVTMNIGLTGSWDMLFIAWTLVACLIGRFANVFGLSYCLNKRRREKITLPFQLQMWHAGLRGAIAYATALAFPSQHRDALVNVTSWICLFTIFAMGGTTTTSLQMLRIPYGEEAQALGGGDSDEEGEDAIDPATGKKLKKKGKSHEDGELPAADRRIKAAMHWADKWVRRTVYGRAFVREMDHANAVAEQQAKIRTAALYGIQLPASVTAPIPPPKDEADQEEEEALAARREAGGGEERRLQRLAMLLGDSSDDEDDEEGEGEESEAEGHVAQTGGAAASNGNAKAASAPSSGAGTGIVGAVISPDSAATATGPAQPTARIPAATAAAPATPPSTASATANPLATAVSPNPHHPAASVPRPTTVAASASTVHFSGSPGGDWDDVAREATVSQTMRGWSSPDASASASGAPARVLMLQQQGQGVTPARTAAPPATPATTAAFASSSAQAGLTSTPSYSLPQPQFPPASASASASSLPSTPPSEQVACAAPQALQVPLSHSPIAIDSGEMVTATGTGMGGAEGIALDFGSPTGTGSMAAYQAAAALDADIDSMLASLPATTSMPLSSTMTSIGSPMPTGGLASGMPVSQFVVVDPFGDDASSLGSGRSGVEAGNRS